MVCMTKYYNKIIARFYVTRLRRSEAKLYPPVFWRIEEYPAASYGECARYHRSSKKGGVLIEYQL